MLRRHDGGKAPSTRLRLILVAGRGGKRISSGRLLLVATAFAATACGGDSTAPPPPPPPVTVTLAKQTDNMDGEVNKPAAVLPSVLVTNASGAPLGGVTVTFAATGTSGSIANPVQVTNPSGIATSGPWTLGTTAGAQVATALAEHAQAVSFSATARPSVAAALAVANGNNQSAVIWHQPPVAPTVVVHDQFGNAVPSGTITFEVSAGGGSITTSSVPVGSDGTAAVQWSLGRSPGPNALSATLVGTSLAPVSVNATATGPTSPYDIQVRFLSSTTTAQQAAIAEAVQRWRVVIAGDVPAQPVVLDAGECDIPDLPAVNETIDDILIFVQIHDIDGAGGILGGGGPCIIRGVGGLPSLGFIELDAADLSSMNQIALNDLLLHEMGHVLGFGTLWPDQELLAGACPDEGVCSTDPQFTGALGRDGYHALGGQQLNVPVEETGGPGTANSHWRESVFLTEVMTGFLDLAGDPLTGMTIGSMQDLGYQVDYASAEPLDQALTAARTRVPRGPALRERPLQSPILVMDAGGRVTERRQRR